MTYSIPARATKANVAAARQAAKDSGLDIAFALFDKLAPRQQLVSYSALAEAGRLMNEQGYTVNADFVPRIHGPRSTYGTFYPSYTLKPTIALGCNTFIFWGELNERHGEDGRDGKWALQTVIHEIGHAIHFQMQAPQWGALRSSPVNHSVAYEVSMYAATNNLEFVAETFTRLILGRTFSRAVMDWYNALGGPQVR